jgi:simple sugar transport system ATP-binding protein
MLTLNNITKRFGHIYANRNISCTFRKGRVTALLGDNGAGKTTLVKMMCGVHQPSAGTMMLDGRPLAMHGPRDALANGITAVYQDLALVDTRDIAHNMSLGRIPTRFGGLLVDRRRMEEDAARVIARMKAQLPAVTTAVSRMSGGQRQAVAIGRALMQGSRLVLMDEPTAALGIREQRMVLDLIRDLRSAGTTVVLISHNLDHVFQVADDLVILRGGRLVAEIERKDHLPDDIAKLILTGQPRDGADNSEDQE